MAKKIAFNALVTLDLNNLDPYILNLDPYILRTVLHG